MATFYDSSPQFEQPQTSRSVNPLLARAFTLDWYTIAYVVIFVLAVFTRFYDLGDRVMSHDESLHTRYSYNLYNEGNFQHTPLMHGPILFHVTAFMYFMFGDNDFTARIYPAVLGIMMVMFPLLFRRWLGKTGALLASIMILISPLLMYYNRYIREDTPSIFYSVVMVYCIFMYLAGPLNQRRKARWLYIMSAAMLGSLGSKETAFMYIAIFGLFVGFYWLVRLAQHIWKLPGRVIFNFLIMGILLGTVVALGMYVVLSIIPPAQISASEINTTSFYSWTMLSIGTVLLALIGTGLWVFRGSIAQFQLRDIVILVLIATVACSGLIYVEERSRHDPGSELVAETADPDAVTETAQTTINYLPIVALWIIATLAVMAIVYLKMNGWWNVFYRFPEFDVIIVIFTLILPWAAPIFIQMTGAKPTDYSQQGIILALLALVPMFAISIALGIAWNWRRWLISAAVFHILFAFFFTTMFTNVQGLASGMVGSLGYWLEQQAVRRGNQPQYYYLLIVMPFYEFLPVIGGVLAMLSGLGIFWRQRRKNLEAELASKEADALLSGEYAATGEELPSLDAVTGAEIDRAAIARQLERTRRLRYMPFMLFVAWWAAFNLIAYTLAGEKMPWLGTHMTFPLIFMTAWFFGRVFDRLDWREFFRSGWVYMLLTVVLFALVFQIWEPFITGQSPFSGLQQQQLSRLYEWIGMALAASFVGYLIYLVNRRVSRPQQWRFFALTIFSVLSLLTARSAWMASFINYDYANEFIVYAHAAPAVKNVLSDLEELSWQITGGMDMPMVYDDDTSWPHSWYYRNFTNATYVPGDRLSPQTMSDAVAVVVGEANRAKVEPFLADEYYHFEYIRMWWPMQDYFGLTAARVANLFDFSAENTQAAQIRLGLWDIWWARDYSTYSNAVSGNWTLTQWPVSDRMHVYVRKDVAAQVWNLGTGEGTVLNPLAAQEINMCTENWQELNAQFAFNTSAPGASFNHPLDIAVGNDVVYVADEFNNRVAVFDLQGNFIGPLTQSVALNRPNGVAVGPDNNIYVADTWNYSIKVFTPSGELLRSWGQPGQFGFEAPQQPVDGFWGPRDIAVDPAGRVYVSDTGNKRVRVYTADGEYITDIGFGGAGDGQLNEPSGLAIHNGQLYVADTWNRRVSVFTLDGQWAFSFPIRGWYDDLGNRPYLTVDAARNLLYVTDPDSGRVLVYDTIGNCVGSFGQVGGDQPGLNQINVAGGITIDALGNVYVSDGRSNRVLQFPPFPAPVVVPDQSEVSPEASVEVTQELGLELTAESTPLLEATPELEATVELTPEVTAAE